MTHDILIGLISGGLTLMLSHWMQYGHILWFIPFYMTPDSPEKRRIVYMPDFAERASQMNDFYWRHARTRPLLRVIICEVCLSVYVFAALFLAWGNYSVLSFVTGISATYLVIRYVP